jgi:hypothetical protein
MSGRPTKYTNGLAEEIVAGISDGLTDKDAALAAGVSEDTFGRWMKGLRGAPADLADRIARARVRRSRRWLGRLSSLADAGDVRAISELLDRCAGPDYRKTQHVEQRISLDVRQAAERAAAELGVPVDVVLAETYRMVEDGA